MNDLATRIPNHPEDCPGVSGAEWTYDGSQCRLCWLATYDERYRVLWGLSDGGAAKSIRVTCAFRGESVGTLIPGKAGCKCQHGPTVYQCRFHDAYAVNLESDWSGVEADPARIPTQMISWKSNGHPGWAEVHSCVACQNMRPREDTPTFRLSSWAVGVTTAPRSIPRLTDTLRSLEEAGFRRSELIVFAEPDSVVPEGYWTRVADKRLGVTANWRRALKELLASFPEADAVAIFQDDLQVSPGLKAFLESLAIPPDAAFVSPYCPATYGPRTGTWNKSEPSLLDVVPEDGFGMKRGGLNGAVSLVFPRPVAELLASDAMLDQDDRMKHLDAVIGHWTHRAGRRTYYCHPSRVWHTGDASTIHVGLTATGHRQAGACEFVAPERNREGEVRIGVVGYNTASGLGTLARQAATHLPGAKFLAFRHDEFATLPPPPGVRYSHCSIRDVQTQADFIKDVDLLLFFERPHGDVLFPLAEQLGVATACVVMYENCPVGASSFMAGANVLICPHSLAVEELSQDVPRHKLLSCPWPVDVETIPFRRRKYAETFAFFQGTGGFRDRKGGEIVASAARLLPTVPFIVRTQLGDKRTKRQSSIAWPKNVTVLGMTDDIPELYALGDVAVQPSRYEGLGLQLIEAQAAGMPLITTNARPMSDYLPWKVVNATPRRLQLQRSITCHDVDPRDLAATIDAVVGADIAVASQVAADNMRRLHSWESLKNEVFAVVSQASKVLG